MNTFVWLKEMQLLQKRGQRCEILDQVENWQMVYWKTTFHKYIIVNTLDFIKKNKKIK
jgi:hypothetical protein